MSEKITAAKIREGMWIMVDGAAAQVTGAPLAEVEHFGRSRGKRVYYIPTTAGEIKLASNALVQPAQAI